MFTGFSFILFIRGYAVSLVLEHVDKLLLTAVEAFESRELTESVSKPASATCAYYSNYNI